MDDRDKTASEAAASGLSSGVSDPTFNRLKKRVSSKLHDTAEAIEQAAKSSNPHNGSPQHGFLEAASDWLNRTADYIGNIDLERLDRDIQDQVRRSPGRSLVIAGAAGLFLGVLLRRR